MYSYPAGTRFGEGPPTENRIVRQAQPFTSHITGVSYGLAHFADAALLEYLEVKPFLEDSVPAHYRGGVPQDIETAATIHRTYPNPVLQAAEWRQQLADAAQAKKTSMHTSGIMVNGVLFDSDASAYGAYIGHQIKLMLNPVYEVERWKASSGVWVRMTPELFAQVMQTYTDTNSAAFNWQSQIDAALAAAPDTYEALLAVEILINT